MGRHHEHHKKHKKDKKKHKHCRRSSSSETEWVEKCITLDEEKNKQQKYKRSGYDSSSSEEKKYETKSSKKTTCDEYVENQKSRNEASTSSECEIEKHKSKSRDEWMDLPTSFLTYSTYDKKMDRVEHKNVENERKQYNPKTCPKELNPYWKDGGDGLPKFKKPADDYEDDSLKNYSAKRSSNWKKKPPVEERIQEVIQKEKSVNNSAEQNNLDGILNEKELNLLAAKLVKAEIMGNTKLVKELKEKLDQGRKALASGQKNWEDQEVVLTHTDSKGLSQPLKRQSDYGEFSGRKQKKKKIETHDNGNRVRFFADDDKYSLKEMFENEKFNTVKDHNSEFIKMVPKSNKKDDLDDIFADNIRKKESDSNIDSRNKDRAINEHKKISHSLDNCKHCLQSDEMLKHLMVSLGDSVYLGLPHFAPLTAGHCFIIPIRHVPCSTQLDENEWTEMLQFRKALVNFFNSENRDVIFFETAKCLFKFPHMVIECVPVTKEEGGLAPIYFKKAIDESETEWTQNKKLVSLKGRDVRKAVPKGLPYFFVSFGMDEGYAHVIEDERMFPSNFAYEIIGGMLDMHHNQWRKPKSQTFEEQSKRVSSFNKGWHEYDCTFKK